MRVPMSWLARFVAVELPAEHLADRLIESGLAVEGVEHAGAEFADVRVGRLETVERHPDSDHLFVTRVDVGDGALQVVTGAPNARRGLVTAVVPAGGLMPGGKQRVEAVEMGGVVSQGVLLSPREAGVGEDAGGLWELPAGPGRPGDRLAEALELEDTVIDVDVYPNRPDCMGVLGIAREVAALLDLPLKEPSLSFAETDEAAGEIAGVTVDSFEDTPRYVARVFTRLPRQGTPWWMARLLYLAGMRSISSVVDVTNYVMLELGQPLHAFDLDNLAGRRVHVRRARDGETITTLDGTERELDGEMLVIADDEVPQALAGLMGGAGSEVGPGTRRVLLEAATFNGALIRRASRRLGMRTESSARFERRLAPELAECGSRRAAALLGSMGAEVARGSVDRRPDAGDERVVIPLRLARLNRVLGHEFQAGEVTRYLRRLQFGVEEGRGPREASAPGEPGPVLRVEVPPWRRDVREEEDLAEEVARLAGYDRVPARLPALTSVGRMSEEGRLASDVRRALAGAGLFEVVTYTFMNPAELDPLELGATHEWYDCLRIANPLAQEASHLRTTLVPGLLRVTRHNVSRRQGMLRLFEVGRVFRPAANAGGDRSLPDERLMVGIAMVTVPGAAPREWYEAPRPLDFFDLKGVIEVLARALSVGRLEWEPAQLPGFHPGRAAILHAAGDGGAARSIGHAAELHPRAAAALELPGRPYLAEIDLTRLAACRRETRVCPLGRYPSVQRDLALLVPGAMTAAEVVGLVRQHAGPLAEEARLFDAYAGPGLPHGWRSLGITITYRAPDRTLSDAEVDAERSRLLEAIRPHGVEVRQ